MTGMAGIRSRAAAALGLRQQPKETGMSELTSNDLAMLNQLGYAVPPPGAGQYTVEALVEEAVTFQFEYLGQPVTIAARHGHALGTIAAADAPIVLARRELWRPLVLSLSYA